ncbi:MAG: hypothetical protein Q4G27_08135 [Flavobacteriaceae bacterium]|nr:hypothetical protein [Flavobacteriaceae bacterium]
MFFKYFLPLFLFLQIQTCDQNSSQSSENKEVEHVRNQDQQSNIDKNTLKTIHLKYFGGMMSVEENLYITPEKMTYAYKSMKQPKEITQVVDTPVEIWRKLLQNFDANQFKTLKNGNSHRVYDGMDYQISVEGEFGEMQVLNPLDENTDLELFFNQLEQIRVEFASKKEE